MRPAGFTHPAIHSAGTAADHHPPTQSTSIESRVLKKHHTEPKPCRNASWAIVSAKAKPRASNGGRRSDSRRRACYTARIPIGSNTPGKKNRPGPA